MYQFYQRFYFPFTSKCSSAFMFDVTEPLDELPRCLTGAPRVRVVNGLVWQIEEEWLVGNEMLVNSTGNV